MRSKLISVAAILVAALVLAVFPARAQDPPLFKADQLDQMLAPIALFPDALLSQVLMATTYPSDVTLAVKWAYAHRDLKGDAAVKAVQDQPWDPSVQSLVAFPQVLAMLGEKPEWVQNLGDAFLAQPNDVMDSVQFLRAKAKAAGNLASNEQQIIAVEPAPPPPQIIVVGAPPPPTQIITIVPANPQVVFVPIYNPIHVFGPWWHPAFPPFFFPPPPRWGWSVVGTGIWWGVGIGVSNAMWGGVDWRRRDVNINVNRWNNINVNNRITSNDRNVSWRHNGNNRHGVPYRDAATRERFQNALGDRNARQDYRGRDLQRDQARQALSDRVGGENLSRDALRDIDRNTLPQRPGASDRSADALRDRAGNVDRSQLQNRAGSVDRAQLQDRAGSVDRAQLQDRASNVDRSQLQNRAAGIDRGQVQNRAASVDRGQLQNRPPSVDRAQLQNRAGGADLSQMQNRAGNVDRAQLQQRAATMDRAQLQSQAASINRDNALRGASSGAQTRQQVDRGAASRQAMQQRAPAVRTGNVSRPAAGTAPARRR